MSNFLSVKNLCFAYGRNYVLENINFNLSAGDYLAIIGPNGSGKTTLIKLLLGLLDPSAGEIKYQPNLLNQGALSYIPQRSPNHDQLFPATVQEIVATGLLASKRRFKFYTKKDYQAVDAILRKLRIEDLKLRKISSLSGGQQQRVLLARSMVSEPRLLILDEPTSALDPEIRESFYRILQDLNSEGVTIILISHDLSSVDKYIDKILFLDRTVIYFGPYANFKRSQAISRYLGLPTRN